MGKLGANADRQYAAIRDIRLLWDDGEYGPTHVKFFETSEAAKAHVKKMRPRPYDWVIAGIQYGAVKVIASKG